MPQTPDVKSSIEVSTRGADPAEAELLRLQILLNEQQAQALETSIKIQKAIKVLPGTATGGT